jgi:hypothetical protein
MRNLRGENIDCWTGCQLTVMVTWDKLAPAFTDGWNIYHLVSPVTDVDTALGVVITGVFGPEIFVTHSCDSSGWTTASVWQTSWQCYRLISSRIGGYCGTSCRNKRETIITVDDFVLSTGYSHAKCRSIRNILSKEFKSWLPTAVTWCHLVKNAE